MRVVIYESSSHGGCFEYAKEIFKAYSAHPEVKECELLVPVNSKMNGTLVFKTLCDDSSKTKVSVLRKIKFLLRTLINPFILLFFLLKRKASLVIFNDFEQLSAIIWIPFFQWFLRKHSYAVVLHDPDRDQYPPSKNFSEFSMKKLMSIMDFGLFHESLPNKIYYRAPKTKYLDIPHGLYKPVLPDLNFLKDIKLKIGNECQSMAILGNIRKEKNYHLAIESLVKLPSFKLIIAGKAANQDVNINLYKQLAVKLKVEHRVLWVEKYLTDGELSSLIQLTDLIILNYAESFKSQSGILNLIAPYEKKIIVSKVNSGLHKIVKRFDLGTLIEPDNLDAFIKGVKESQESDFRGNWKNYLGFASWGNHTNLVVKAYRSLEESKFKLL